MSDTKPTHCAYCNAPLTIPEKDGVFLPCPKCQRVYCDHPPAERGDGICPNHHVQPTPPDVPVTEFDTYRAGQVVMAMIQATPDLILEQGGFASTTTMISHIAQCYAQERERLRKCEHQRTTRRNTSGLEPDSIWCDDCGAWSTVDERDEWMVPTFRGAPA